MPVDSDVPERLYHYTDEAGLTGIIESQTLWATEIRHLNDVTEGQYARELLGTLTERLRTELGGSYGGHVTCEAATAIATAEVKVPTFVTSLCVDGDNLGQWRGYGDYAIGLDRERLRKVASAQDHSLIRLIYDEADQEAELRQVLSDCVPIFAGWGADPTSAPPAEQQLIMVGIGLLYAMLAIKNPYFRDEREWRLARVVVPGLFEERTLERALRGKAIAYEEIPLSPGREGESPIVEIVVGPRVRLDAAVANIRDVLDRNGLTGVAIRKSAVPLRP